MTLLKMKMSSLCLNKGKWLMCWIYILCCVSETVNGEQLAQLQILNKAQQRQIEDLEQKLEDSRRNMRYLEHQFAIVKGMFHTVFAFKITRLILWYFKVEI